MSRRSSERLHSERLLYDAFGCSSNHQLSNIKKKLGRIRSDVFSGCARKKEQSPNTWNAFHKQLERHLPRIFIDPIRCEVARAWVTRTWSANKWHDIQCHFQNSELEQMESVRTDVLSPEARHEEESIRAFLRSCTPSMEKYTGLFVDRGIRRMSDLRALQNMEKDDRYQVLTNMVEDQVLNHLDAAVIALHFHEEYLNDVQFRHVD